MSECTRVYNEQQIDCPCHANCPNGCPCPNYECKWHDENETTPAPTTTTTELITTTTTVSDKDQKAVLVLQAGYVTNNDDEGILIGRSRITDLNGRADRIDFSYGENTELEDSCSIVFNGQAYVYGGWEQKRQISTIDGCQLKRIASLDFDFKEGACTSTSNTIYLCFENGNGKACRTANNPTGPFGAIADSTFEHSYIQIAASSSEF